MPAPFLDAESFARHEREAPAPPPPPPPAPSSTWSPFLSVYEATEWEDPSGDEAGEAYATLINELDDEEFDESLFELLTTGRGLHQSHLASGYSAADADRIVTQHFSQLMRESDAMLDAMARRVGSGEAGAVEGELDQFAELYAPGTALEPEFEDFLGKLARKIGKGVKAVAKVAAKFAIGPVLNKIKALVRPLLNQVLQKAIGRLPAAVQPVARTLGEKLGILRKAPAAAAAPSPEPASAGAAAPPPAAAAGAADPAAPLDDVGSPVQPAAGTEIPELQLEFDTLVAEAMLSDSEADFELETARARAALNVPAEPVFANLDEARERLAHELENLKEGENPAPYVENFLPAVLPALKIATRLIGRPRVVGFLAGLLGKLISRLVGPQNAPALSRAMVDAGLKLINLEVADQESPRLGTSAVTATIEETLTRVASLPDHVLDDQELLEGFALDAFEQAAGANLPRLFSDTTYRKRPELIEGGVNAAWVMLPLRRPRYKRCSRTFNVTITPHMGEAIEGFDNTPLSDYLQDQLGYAEGEDVQAEVHLYEVIPGGDVGDIARHETETPGLGAADEATVSQLQPLTQEAAGVLLGKPGLGRRLHPASGVRGVAPGQRVFHMVVGRRPVTVEGARGRRRPRRLARLKVILDTPRDQVRVCVFFSEVKAQRLAVRLRQQSHVGALAVAFQKLVARRLPAILQGKRPRRLRVVHPAVTPGPAAAQALRQLPAIGPAVFVAKMQEWLTAGFSEFVKTQGPKFLAASENPADGVTLVFTVAQPPGFKEMAQLLGQKGAAAPGVAEGIARGAAPTVTVEALPGHKCD